MRPIDRSILAIALPAIVSNITVPVLGLVDVAIVGHFGAAAFIGAIAVGSTLFNMLYWLLGFLRMATAGLTAQAFGAADRRASDATLWRSLVIAAVFAVLLIALSTPLGRAILDFLDADEAVRPLAERYFSICIWGAPAVLATYVFNGWSLGMQNTRLPMVVAITTNVVNIVLSLAFVYGAGMQLEGVALGTMLSQWLGAVIFVTCIIFRYKLHRVARIQLFDATALRRLFSINTDIFLRTLCLVAVTVWFTRAGAGQGVAILAANALLMQLFMFFSYFSDGFAYAGEALAGKAHGAADSAGLRQTVKALLQWGAGIAVAFTIIYYVGGEVILRLLTDEPGVVATAREYLPWAVAVPACGILAFIYDGIFIGLTATRRMLVSIAVSAGVFFGVYALAFSTLGNHGLWLAFDVYLLLRGLWLALAMRS